MDELDLYYCYNDPVTGKVEVASGHEVVKTFYPLWKERMVKAGRNLGDFCQMDCLYDWISENYAWVSDE